MAQVDFSSAVLTKPTSVPWSVTNLYLNDRYFKDASNQTISTATISRTNTAARLTHAYSGTFNASGTEFYIGDKNYWKVSNISFSSGDSYNFAIDIDITVD